MKELLGWVNFGRLLPPKVGHYCTPIYNAVGNEELDVGVKCVGAPIRDYTRQVIGAVSISGPSMRLSAERMNTELMPLVKKAAEEISIRLGYY